MGILYIYLLDAIRTNQNVLECTDENIRSTDTWKQGLSPCFHVSIMRIFGPYCVSRIAYILVRIACFVFPCVRI